MPDPFDPNQFNDAASGADPVNQPYGIEAGRPDEDAPRREASARYVVDADIGSDAVLRDAMDPANQSLAEALRLSFRVLQVVILILIVLFLASGFKTVDDGQSGVLTVWGKIVPYRGESALGPGPKFTAYPYPAGEFVVFDVENRSIDVTKSFAPHLRGKTRAQAIDAATIRTRLIPGTDGSLLTQEGDIAHLELSARFAIEHPVEFIENINDADFARNAERLVRHSLERATVHVASGSTLQDFLNVNLTEDLGSRIQKEAQETLDSLSCGIRITSVHVSDSYAPLSIEKVIGQLQEAQVDASKRIERAQQKADETLNRVAGGQYNLLIDLIDQFERAMDRNDTKRSDALFGEIRQLMEGGQITGEVSQIIQGAQAYQSEIESTLGNEYRRFKSLLPAYKKNPRAFVVQHWFDAFAYVTQKKDAEVIHVPLTINELNLFLSGSTSIQEIRRKQSVDRRRKAAEAGAFDDLGGRIPRAADMTDEGKAGRRFTTDEHGKLEPLGAKP